MRKFPARFLVSVAASIIVFTLIIIAFNLVTGWPISPLTLVITVGVAWFFAAGLAGKISGNKWSVAVPTLLAIGLIATTVSAGVPWDLRSEEMVTFKMEASFTYWGSENNLPIENVLIGFPCPNLENAALTTYGSWILYYLEDDNSLTLQADESQVYNFKGMRKTIVGVINHGIDLTYISPMYFLNIDRLYPREVFWISAFVYVPIKDASKVSLIVYGDNQKRSIAGYKGTFPSGEYGKAAIDLSFWAQLSRRINGNNYEPIETFSRHLDNVWDSFVRLFPY
ncbi:MAG: hypothetical protein QXT02_03700 [Candidatus Hadarchaeum sp.]|uniref:hypothetical protein n=1 Tax=Candidatus Hadarchaeum sp. TaxID=2883567 RepID=UPI00316F9652